MGHGEEVWAMAFSATQPAQETGEGICIGVFSAPAVDYFEIKFLVTLRPPGQLALRLLN